MASDKKPSMYSNRGAIGSAEELETYGVWVKSEPQDFTASLAEAASFNADALPYEADFDTGFDNMGRGNAGFDLLDAELNIPEIGVDDDGIMADAEQGSGEAPTQMLTKIAGELSSIRSELNTLKREFAEIRGGEDADPFATAGEDDEKIALSGDEMESFFNASDFPAGEDMDFDPGREADEAALKEVEAQNEATVSEEEEIHINFDNLGNLDDAEAEAPQEELPSLDSLADNDDFAMPSFDPLSFEEAPADEAPASEPDLEEAAGFAEELVPLEGEDAEIQALRLEGAEPLTPPPDNTDYLEEDPFALNNADLEGSDIEPSTLEESALSEELVQEPAIEEELALEELAVEKEELTFEEPAAEEEELILAEEPAAEEEELILAEEPVVEEEELILAEEPAAEEEELTLTEEPVVEEELTLTEEPAVEEEELTLAEEPAAEEELALTEEPVVEEEELTLAEEPAVEEELTLTEEPAVAEEESALAEEASAETAVSETADITLDELSFDETSFDIGLDDFSAEPSPEPSEEKSEPAPEDAVIDEPNVSEEMAEAPAEEPVLDDVSFSEDDLSLDMDDLGTDTALDAPAEEPEAEAEPEVEAEAEPEADAPTDAPEAIDFDLGTIELDTQTETPTDELTEDIELDAQADDKVEEEDDDITFDASANIQIDDLGTVDVGEDIALDTQLDDLGTVDFGAGLEPETSVEPEADIEPEAELEPEVSLEPEVELEPEVSLEPEVELEPAIPPAKAAAKPPAAPANDIISDIDDSVIPEGLEVDAKEADPSLDDDLEAFAGELAITEDELSSDSADRLADDSGEFSAIPTGLKNELKNVLSYMDHLLESLPEDKIEEFAQSEYFDKYKKIFKELGLV